MPYFATDSLLRHGYLCIPKERKAVKAVIFHIVHNGFKETEFAKPTRETIVGYRPGRLSVWWDNSVNKQCERSERMEREL